MDTQFIENLKQSLAASLQADANMRQQAEQFLQEAQKRPDYCSGLLEVSGDTQIDQNLSLAAAVQLGTCVDYHWKYINPEQAEKISITGFRFIILSEADKDYVRTNIVAKMFNCTSRAISKQYVRCIITICRFDYPEKWPTLVQDIGNALNSGNDKGILTGCIALFCLAKKYEYELDEARQPLFRIMEDVNSILGQIIERYMAQIQEESAQTVLHQIVKIFYTANQLWISPFLRVNNALSPWMQMFKFILDLPVPAELETPTEDIDVIVVRDKAMLWKLKSQAARITYRLFSRYANTTRYLGNDDEEKAWCQQFQQNYAEMLCESHLQLMFKRKTHYVGTKTLNFVIKLVSSATKVELTMQKMLPFLENILYETAIPLMLVSSRDQQLFHDDPIEYIRKQQDIMETIYMPKVTTVELVQLICKYKSTKGRKQKPDYLMPFLNFVSTNMQQYADALAAGSNPDWRVKEALLYSVGSLNEDIGLYPDLANNIEPMLKAHVMPDFQSAHPLLRTRACWVYGEFSNYEFTDKAHVQHAVDQIYKSLFAEELPIKFAAALALSQMLKNEDAIEFLKPALKNILEVYLKIMEDIDSEELIGALEIIMEKYSEDIGPFAVQLAQQLTNKYQALVTEDNGDDDDAEEERALAAAGCVTAIRRILEACNKDKQQLIAILPIVYPILLHSLTPDGLDCIDEGIDCVNIFLYYACTTETRAPPELWKLVPQMMFVTAGNDNDIDGGFAFEMLGQVVIVLQNFIAKDPQTFLSVGEGQTETYFELTVKFMRRLMVVNANSKHKQDGISTLRVLISIFENLPGQIEQAMPMLVGMLLAELKMAFEGSSPSNYKSMLLQSLSMALYNSSATTLAIIENEQQTFAVFGNWLQFMSKFKLEFEIRRIVFGLLAILKVPGNQMPQLVQQQLPAITQHIGNLATKVYEQRIKTLEENEKYIAKGFEDDDDESGDEFDDDDVDEAGDFEKMKSALMGMKKGGKDDDFDDSDDDDDDADYEETAGEYALYDSPLENTDELITIKQTLDQIYQTDQTAYQYITSAQKEDERNKMIDVLGKADDLKQREAACKKAFEDNETAKKVQSIKA